MHLALLSLALATAFTSACDRNPGELMTSALGDPDRGRALSRRYGCHTCHAIPGVEGAGATVGPPLDRLGVRGYAGGQLNTPANLAAFLRDPRAVDPRTPMPDVGVTDADARDLVAFLFTLR